MAEANLLIDLLVELLVRVDRWREAVQLVIVTRVGAHVAMSYHRILEAGTEVRVLVHHVRVAEVACRLLALRLLPKLAGLVFLLVLVVELGNKARATVYILVAMRLLVAQAPQHLLCLHAGKLVALHDKDSRTNLDDVVHLQRV